MLSNITGFYSEIYATTEQIVQLYRLEA